jgi:hypothetical protein
MTAPAEYLKIYPPPPEISVTWRTKVLSVSLPPRDLCRGITLFAPVPRLLEIYLFDDYSVRYNGMSSVRDTHFCYFQC